MPAELLHLDHGLGWHQTEKGEPYVVVREPKMLRLCSFHEGTEYDFRSTWVKTLKGRRKFDEWTESAVFMFHNDDKKVNIACICVDADIHMNSRVALGSATRVTTGVSFHMLSAHARVWRSGQRPG